MMNYRRMIQYIFMVLLALFLGAFLLLPVFTVVRSGCEVSLFKELFLSPVYREGLLNSLNVAVVTTLMVAVISLTLALLYDRFDFAGKEYCSLLMLLPMILPPFGLISVSGALIVMRFSISSSYLALLLNISMAAYIAAFIERGSAMSLPAISYAVPWSGEVLTTGRPAV